MKKSFLFVSVVAAMLFVGCTGDKKSKPEAVNSKDSCVVMEGVASDKASLVTYTLPSVANTSRCKDYNLTSYIHIGTPIAGSQAKLKDSKQICEHIVNERNDLSECHRAQVITCLKADAKTRMYDIEVIKRELVSVIFVYYCKRGALYSCATCKHGSNATHKRGFANAKVAKHSDKLRLACVERFCEFSGDFFRLLS